MSTLTVVVLKGELVSVGIPLGLGFVCLCFLNESLFLLLDAMISCQRHSVCP